MYLLITTPRFVLGYDTSSGHVEVLHTGSRYYGLTWNPAGDVLALTHANYDGELNGLADYAMSDTGFVAVGDRRSSGFLSMPHQAHWIDDGNIALTNTGRNCVARLAISDMSVVQERYDAAVWDRFDSSGEAGAHYNSVFHDGTFVYFVAHNFQKQAFIVKAEWPTLRLLERVPVEGAYGVHNLWIDDSGRWLVCDSHRGALIDAQSGARLWDCRGQGFTRGLAATDEVIAIGHSENSIRDKREYTASGVWLVDRATMELRDFLFLGHFGGVHEVRIADEPDACHQRQPLRPDALRALRANRGTVQRDLSQRARARIPDPSVWRPELGTFLVEDDRFVSKDGAFALMTRRGSERFANGRLSVQLHVRGAGETDHAALVARYSGPEDLRMYAAIFRWQGPGGLAASLWVEDDGWTCLGTKSVPSSSLSGIDLRNQGLPISLELKGPALHVSVGERELLSATNANLASGAVGLRTIGNGFAFSHFECTS